MLVSGGGGAWGRWVSEPFPRSSVMGIVCGGMGYGGFFGDTVCYFLWGIVLVSLLLFCTVDLTAV